MIDAGDGGGYFYGADGDDILRGGVGKDVIIGGLGNDLLSGGNDTSDDYFTFSGYFGRDTITDMHPRGTGYDVIDLTGFSGADRIYTDNFYNRVSWEWFDNQGSSGGYYELKVHAANGDLFGTIDINFASFQDFNIVFFLSNPPA